MLKRSSPLLVLTLLGLSNAFLAHAPFALDRVLKCRHFDFDTAIGSSSSSSEVYSSSNLTSSSTPPLPPPPVLNGQRVLPTKVLLAGLQGLAPVSAVYAVLGSSYKRGSDGWGPDVQYVGITQDLGATIQTHAQEQGADRVAHIRALSFSFPQPSAMQAVATQWREKAVKNGANLDDQEVWTRNVLEYLSDTDTDEDDDDDEDEWPLEMTTKAMETINELDSNEASATAVVSPFAASPSSSSSEDSTTSGLLPLTTENIDQVLEEIRPYLIADGGNVAVSRVDPSTKTVYLKLQGACGSCPSSTVTMQMGIERVLKENFDVLHVLQEDNDDRPKELTWEAVEQEVNRIRPAIQAMGGVCDLVSVDSVTGVVQIKFRGFNKVQQGLELAIRDIPFVNAVQFVQGD